MNSEIDAERQAAAWLSRVVEAITHIQGAGTAEAARRALADAARGLVRAKRASEGSAKPASAPADGMHLELVASDGKSLGSLSIASSDGDAFSAGERALLAEFARLGGWALENVLLRERLVEQEERLRLALDAASLGTWEHIPSTHSTYWDARSKAIFGLAPEEDLDFERYTAALHPDDREHVFAGIGKATDPDGTGECTLRYRIRDAHGVERWVEAHGRCDFEDGVPQRINGTLLDITERQRAEDAVREATRRKDEFLAVLGHELRNPLAPILTALELMRLSQPEQFVREREVIERQVRHMMRLVDDLLDLARITRGSIALRRELTELRGAVDRAVEISAPLFEDRQHRLEVEVPAGIWVSVDRVRFAQVVSNLLTNAAKFTPPGGGVRVRASQEGSTVLLEVEDNGIGVDPENLASLFTPFVQVARRNDPALGGLGLGLALVRDLVQLHGGTVTAASEGPGRGSRFSIRLPAAAPAPERSRAREPARSTATSERRVLVVDDNQDSAEMLGMLIAELGHVVRVAYDGPGALAAAAELEPDLAVLDIGLPVMDGYELAARLREQHADRGLRLIALSGFGQDQDKARSREAGFFRHLTKPVDAKELAAVLSD